MKDLYVNSQIVPDSNGWNYIYNMDTLHMYSKAFVDTYEEQQSNRRGID